jgi:hypothetical protein
MTYILCLESQKRELKVQSRSLPSGCSKPVLSVCWLETVVRDNNLKFGSAKKQDTVSNIIALIKRRD